MGLRNLRPLPKAHVPTALDPDFDGEVLKEDVLGLLGVAKGRSVGSDEQYSAGEMEDILFDPIE